MSELKVGDVAVEMKFTECYWSNGEVLLRNPKLLDFNFKMGDFVCIVGPTGSGKTTVIRLLCRLYEPQEGRIHLDGRDIRSIPISDLRRQLAVVLQDTFLFSGNVADNLRLNAAISDRELGRICRDLGLQDLLRRLPWQRLGAH